MVSEPKTYVFDFDSTLVTVESLEELARIALANHSQRSELLIALESLTKQGMAGELTFDASLRERLKLFEATKQDVENLVAYLQTKISPSAQDNKAWFKSNAANIYVVSGGFKDFIWPITDELSIQRNHVFANEFVYAESGLIKGFVHHNPLSKPQGKAEQLKSLQLPHPLVMIGDGYTDYEPKQYGYADEFWCFTETVSRPNAMKYADRHINSFAGLI